MWAVLAKNIVYPLYLSPLNSSRELKIGGIMKNIARIAAISILAVILALSFTACDILTSVLPFLKPEEVHEHTLGEWYGNDATCTEAGTESRDCLDETCDYVESAPTEALGHDEVAHDGKAASCTEHGYEAYVTCARCDYTTYTEIPALGHDEVAHEAKAASCTESGYEAYVTCERCDYNTFSEIPALGHSYADDICTECGDEDPNVVKYTVTVDDGDVKTTYIVKEGNKLDAPKDPTKNGYTFLGWYVNEEKWSFADNAVGADTDIYAKWELDVYNVTYELDGGTNAEGNDTTYSVESGDIVLSDPTKDGYIFLGWYLDESFETRVEVIGVGLCRDVTVYAKWQFDMASLFAYTVSDGEATITGYTGTETTVVIPTELGGYPVVAIGDDAFMRNYNIVEVVMQDGIRLIDGRAFYGCSSLAKVTLPSTLTEIGWYAFMECAFTEVVLPEGLPSIGNGAFQKCKKLTKVTVPSTLTYFDQSVFSNCTSLKSVYITDMEAWCNSSFYNINSNPLCNGADLYLNGELVTEMVLPDGITSISNYLFYGCTSLVTVVIPESVTSIGSHAFGLCDNISFNEYENGLYIPSETNPHFYFAQAKSKDITSAVIHADAKYLSGYAFKDVNYLEVLYFNATAMNGKGSESSFNNTGKNASATKIVIGKDVANIPAYTFIHFNNLDTVEFEAGSVCQSIGNRAFYSCSSITSIQLPESLTAIGEFAFDGCSKISVINLPVNLVSVGGGAFNGCRGITEIRLDAAAMNDLSSSNSVFLIGNNENGVKLVIGKNVTKIPAHLFHPESSNYAPNITSIEFESGSVCEVIGNYAFSNLSNLTEIALPESLVTIGDYALSGCSSLGTITIPNSVVTIGRGAFSGCSGFTSIVIPENVISIGDYAFHTCLGLTNVTVPANVTSLAGSVFYGCSNLVSVTLGEGVTNIGMSLFEKCTSLEEVIILGGVKKIDFYAFNGCTGLDRIYFKGTSEEWSKIDVWGGDGSLAKATVYFYSESASAGAGNLWCYDADGNIVAYTA